MLYKSKITTLETMTYSWYVDEYSSMGPRGRFHSYKCYIGLFGTGLYMGRAPRTKETLPDFRERSGHPTFTNVSVGLRVVNGYPGFGASQLGIRA